MEKKEVLENISFQMVSAIHDARSYYLKAIQAARARAFAQAQQFIESGDERYNAGHAAHTQLLQMEAAGDITNVNLLVMHAEDQLISAENYKVLAIESIHIYQAIQEK